MKKLLAVLVVLTLVFTLVACQSTNNNSQATTTKSTAGGDTQTSGTSKATEPQPKKGGIIQLTGGNQDTILFHQVRSVPAVAGHGLFQETLMKYDEAGVPQPFLIDSISGDTATKIWTLKVKKGIKFTDGSDLNADVVAWNINIYKEKGVFKDSFYASVKEAKAVDDYTVEVHMNNWDSLFPYTLARTCPIASKVAYETYGEDYLAEHPIGTGPFILEKWERDIGMDLKPNPNYWQGAPLVDGIRMTVYNNALVAQAAMDAGELHAMVTDDYNLAKQMEQKGYTIYPAAVPTYGYTLCFETNDPEDPFYDVRVRKAVSHAINVDEILDTLFHGYGIKSTQWCTPKSEFYNDKITGQPYDVAKAKELLAEAGYPNGFKTKLTTGGSTLYSDMCLIIIEQLSKVGIEVEFMPVEGTAFIKYIGGWEEGMFLHPMGMENGAASQISANFVQGLSFALGVGSFDHPDDLDAMIRAANYAEADKVAGMFQDIQKVLFEDLCYMKVIAIAPTIGIVSPKLKDSNYYKVQAGSSTFYKAWLDE